MAHTPAPFIDHRILECLQRDGHISYTKRGTAAPTFPDVRFNTPQKDQASHRAKYARKIKTG